MGWLRGQQTDFPGISSPDFGEGGPSTLHSRSQLHCIPTSTPDFGGGGGGGGGNGVGLHSLTADHNFTVAKFLCLDFLRKKNFLHDPSPISALGEGGGEVQSDTVC